MTGVHSSSRPASVRISRVLPWPRSPSRTRSCPASRARSSCGSTVSSKPTMPGNGSRPARSAASRLSRISVLDAARCAVRRTRAARRRVLGRVVRRAVGASPAALTPRRSERSGARIAAGRSGLGQRTDGACAQCDVGRHAAAPRRHAHRAIALGPRHLDPQPAARPPCGRPHRGVRGAHRVDDVHDGLDAVTSRRSPRPAWPRTAPRSRTTSPPPTTCSPPLGARASARVVWASSETVLGCRSATDPATTRHIDRPPRSRSAPAAAHRCRRGVRDGPPVRRWVPDRRWSELRSPVMDRDDDASVPACRRRPAVAQLELWGYIDGRDGAQAVRRASSTARPATPASRSS